MRYLLLLFFFLSHAVNLQINRRFGGGNLVHSGPTCALFLSG